MPRLILDTAIEEHGAHTVVQYGTTVCRAHDERGSILGSHIATAVWAILLLLGACSEDRNAKILRYLTSGEQYLKERKYSQAALQFRNAIILETKSSKAHYGLARAYLNLGNPAAAFEELSATVAIQPTNWDAQLDLANLHTARGEFDKATACVEKVLKANPNHPLGRATLAMKYAATKDWGNAATEFEKAIRLAPDQVDFYTGLGRAVYVASGKLAEAEAVFKRAIAANPKSVPAYLELARFYEGQRRPEGEAAARAAMELEPKSVAPRLMLARAHIATGRIEEAEKQFRELKSIAPDDPVAYQALGNFYAQTGAWEKSIAEFQSVLASKNDITVKQRLIDILIERQRFNEAEALNQDVLKTNNDNALAHFAQGRILIARDQKQDAATALQKAAVLAPSSPEIHYLLGTVNASLGNAEQAKKSFGKALELQPGLTDASVALASLAAAAGDKDAALRLTAKALELDPKSLPAQVARAEALLRRGDMRQSEVILLDVLSREPASIPALTLLASISVKQKKGQEFLKRVAPLVEQQPKNAGLRYLLALAHHVTGDGQKAEAQAKEVLRLDQKTPRIHLLLASIHLAANNLELVKSELRAAIDSDPREVSTYLLLAERYEKERNWNEAKQLYEKARQIDRDSPVLANQLAYLYLEHGGDVNVALGLAQQARQKLPDSPEVADTLGWAYYKHGLADQAIPHLRRCVDALPANSACQYHLGMAYAASKNSQAATKHLQLALKDPNAPWADSAKQALGQLSKGGR